MLLTQLFTFTGTDVLVRHSAQSLGQMYSRVRRSRISCRCSFLVRQSRGPQLTVRQKRRAGERKWYGPRLGLVLCLFFLYCMYLTLLRTTAVTLQRQRGEAQQGLVRAGSHETCSVYVSTQPLQDLKRATRVCNKCVRNRSRQLSRMYRYEERLHYFTGAEGTGMHSILDWGGWQNTQYTTFER